MSYKVLILFLASIIAFAVAQETVRDKRGLFLGYGGYHGGFRGYGLGYRSYGLGHVGYGLGGLTRFGGFGYGYPGHLYGGFLH